MSEKRTAFILIFFAIFAVGITIAAYNSKEGLDLRDKIANTKDRFFTTKGLNIKFSVHTSIAEGTLSIKYFIPCVTMEQRTNLLKNLPVIRHGIMMALNRPKMIKTIQRRDFESIKKSSLKVINESSIKYVDKIYLDYFSIRSPR